MSRAIHFIEQRDRSKPFFLNVSFARPHSPYVPPEWYFNLYHDQETPLPYIGDWSGMNDVDFDSTDVNAWRGKQSAQRIHRARSGYYGEISFLDAQIGRLKNWMERHEPETWNNSWLIFTSDHGDMVGDHHLWRKTYAYEGSLLPLIRGNTDRWRSYIHGEHCLCYAAEQEMQYVTDGHRKFIWLPRIDQKQFFDLDKDPGECHNLIENSEYENEIARWAEYLVSELQARDCGWVVNGKLTCPKEPLVSPFKNKRFRGQQF